MHHACAHGARDEGEGPLLHKKGLDKKGLCNGQNVFYFRKSSGGVEDGQYLSVYTGLEILTEESSPTRARRHEKDSKPKDGSRHLMLSRTALSIVQNLSSRPVSQSVSDVHYSAAHAITPIRCDADAHHLGRRFQIWHRLISELKVK